MLRLPRALAVPPREALGQPEGVAAARPKEGVAAAGPKEGVALKVGMGRTLLGLAAGVGVAGMEGGGMGVGEGEAEGQMEAKLGTLPERAGEADSVWEVEGVAGAVGKRVWVGEPERGGKAVQVAQGDGVGERVGETESVAVGVRLAVVLPAGAGDTDLEM
jgi:hypothetical protein